MHAADKRALPASGQGHAKFPVERAVRRVHRCSPSEKCRLENTGSRERGKRLQITGDVVEREPRKERKRRRWGVLNPNRDSGWLFEIVVVRWFRTGNHGSNG